VALAGEEDLSEIGGHAELDELARRAVVVEGEGGIWLVDGLSALNEELVDDATGDGGERKGVKGAAHIAARVTVGKTADEDMVERGAGDDAELASQGNGLGQPPVGDTDAHAALDNRGDFEHR
jgi:hypothetical protein